MTTRPQPGMGCAVWTVALSLFGYGLMILGMQTALEMVKQILGAMQ